MKKLAIIAALTLAIGASVTAGTMAKYSQTLDTQRAVVQAKSFIIDAEYDTVVEDIKPGDVYKYEFTVKNDGEVDAVIDIKTDLGDSPLLNAITNSWPAGENNENGQPSLKDENGEKINEVGVNENPIFNYQTELKAGESKTYTLEVPWVAEVVGLHPMESQENLEASNTAVQGQSGNILIQVTGTQK